MEKILTKNLEKQITTEDKESIKGTKKLIREEVSRVINNPSTDLTDIKKLGGQLSEKLA